MTEAAKKDLASPADALLVLVTLPLGALLLLFEAWVAWRLCTWHLSAFLQVTYPQVFAGVAVARLVSPRGRNPNATPREMFSTAVGALLFAALLFALGWGLR